MSRVSEYDRIVELYNYLLNFGDIQSSTAITFEPRDKDHASRLKMTNRDFKMIEEMFSLEGKQYIKKSTSTLKFNINGYRYFMLNNPSIRRKDLYLRFQYIKTNREKIEERTDILDLISTNIQDAISDIDSFKTIEKDEKVKIINKSVLENKKLIISSKNKEREITPLKIYYANGYWYFASLRDDASPFWIRIDNIIKIELSEKKIEISRKELEKNRNYQWDAFGNEKSEKRCTIILQLDNEHSYKFFKLKKYKIQQKEFIENGSFFVEFKFNYDWEIKPLLFQWLNVITIVDIDCTDNKENEFLESLTESLKFFIEKDAHKSFFKFTS